PADPKSLSANLVRAIHETADGELWFGTQSGLNRLLALDAQGAQFEHWLPRDGLPGGTVYALASDAMGRIWLSTNRGIASFEHKSGKFHAFTLADGLQGMEFNGGAVATLRNGQIAFGGTNGLNLFAPQSISASRYPAPVAITRVQVGPRELPVAHAGGTARMDAGDRIVRFEFAALDYAAPERNRFSYRLEGFDDDWVDAGTRHDATYTNLGPGTYTFTVRASNHDGYWSSNIARTRLSVVPPWWASPLARAAWLLLAAIAIVLGWSARRRQRRQVYVHHLDLKEREDRLRLALWGSGDDFWDWDMISETIVVTGTGDLFKGGEHDPNVLDYTWFRERMHPDDMPLVRQRLQKHIDRSTETFESEHRLRNHRGEWVWSLARGKIVERDEDGKPLRMCGTARDVTLERAAEHDRRVAHEVIHSMSEAVSVTDTSHRFISVNPAFTRMTGWRREEALGRSASLLDCSQHPPEHYLAIREELGRSGHWRGELWQRRRNGEEFLSKVEISEIRDGSGVRTHFVSVISDITDRKRAEQELRYLANYDALTGLPNRTLLTERIGHAIIRARRGNRKVAVLFLDLDRFKHVNDSMGHAAGDRMLKAAGSRLRHVVREGDSVARLGGDEFTVVLENIGSSAEAERVAEKIIAAFEEPLELDNGQEVVISPSIGIAMHPDHGQVPSDLL
ncbi:MAG TPA: diguanylate cyclase, partial [Dokdonella sp.]